MKFFYSGVVVDSKYIKEKDSSKHCDTIEKRNNLPRNSITYSENINN